MLDFNIAPPVDISARINGIIDSALEMEESFSESRKYLGGSRLGGHCERALQYEFTHHPKDEGRHFSGRILDIFARGHWIESHTIKTLIKSGFGITTETRDGGQYGFVAHGGYVKGHLDGILIAGPQDLGPWPRLWEGKGLGAKYWRAVVKNGLKKERPTYYGQVQYYMAKRGLTANPAYWVAINADTMERYWEAVPFDPEYAEKLDGKAGRIIAACQAGELLRRDSERPDFYKCKMCDYRLSCHGI